MAEWYAEDATYGWMYSVDEHFMAVGRDQIRDYAIGIEMDGLDGWHYDYQCTMIDERRHGRRLLEAAVGHPRRRAARSTRSSASAARGSASSARPRGADDGLIKFAWQRDWFDMPSTAHTFMEIVKAGKAPDTLLKRM